MLTEIIRFAMRIIPKLLIVLIEFLVLQQLHAMFMMLQLSMWWVVPWKELMELYLLMV